MARLEIRPFSEEYLPHAGELLAARHRAHRTAEPLLPERYEDTREAAAEVEALSQTAGAFGAVALRGSRVVGYVLGAPRTDAVWGANVWVELAGHAVEDAEDLRDLYAAAAAGWVEAGHVDHYALVPASDANGVRAWSRVGFGQQHAAGIREVPEVGWPDSVRLAEQSDVDALLELAPLMREQHRRSPVFSAGRQPAPPEELRAEILEDLANEPRGDLVFEQEGRIVAWFALAPAELSSVHIGLARPDGAVLLGWAATRPELRGNGAGVALTRAGFAWAREQGRHVMVVDWRVANLLASRFWPARGFRETFLRLYRHIP
jgi:ribosomal protein S18 acetylase RimI-like enzyme